jgi:hypothetical protein
MAADDKQPLRRWFRSSTQRPRREAAMRTTLVLFASVLAFAACQSVPEKTAQLEEPRERCDTVLTGSRIPQCNRGDVRIMTREEVERAGPLFNPAAGNPDMPPLPGRSH